VAEYFNHHSFVLLGLGLWLGLAVPLVAGRWLRGKPVRARDGLALATVAGALFAAWLGLRSGPGTQAAADVEATIGQGQPVLVEFYSDY
jgi:hypothetical protein